MSNKLSQLWSRFTKAITPSVDTAIEKHVTSITGTSSAASTTVNIQHNTATTTTTTPTTTTPFDQNSSCNNNNNNNNNNTGCTNVTVGIDTIGLKSVLDLYGAFDNIPRTVPSIGDSTLAFQMHDGMYDHYYKTMDDDDVLYELSEIRSAFKQTLNQCREQFNPECEYVGEDRVDELQECWDSEEAEEPWMQCVDLKNMIENIPNSPWTLQSLTYDDGSFIPDSVIKFIDNNNNEVEMNLVIQLHNMINYTTTCLMM